LVEAVRPLVEAVQLVVEAVRPVVTLLMALVHRIFFLSLQISNRLACNLIFLKMTMKAGTYQTEVTSGEKD
jgi:hypothetical protein